MTTNKPEVVAWMKPAPRTMNSVDSVITSKERRGASRMTLAGYKIALVRLSDYEALQAENEALREVLEDMVNQVVRDTAMGLCSVSSGCIEAALDTLDAHRKGDKA